MHRIVKKICGTTETYFKYIFLGRITEIKEKDSAVILYKNRFVRWLLSRFKMCNHRIKDYLETSAFMKLIYELKKGLFFLPVKTSSIILITAILVNIFFTIISNREIELLGWIIRGLLFFVAICGLNSQVDWPTVKSSSLFLRLFSKKCAGFAER